MSSTAKSQVVNSGPLTFLRQRSIGSILAWMALLVGAVLPWCIAIAVKLQLDTQGKPTWDWLYFFHPTSILYEFWATLWFSVPGVGVAFLCYLLFSNRHGLSRRFNTAEKALVVLASLLAGVLGSIPVFVDTFWEFHPIVLIVPFFITILYVGYYVLGLGVGLTLAFASCWIRRRAHHDRAV